MTPPLEHDYIGLSMPPSRPDGGEGEMSAGSLRETELRLGLPGSRSPERKVVLTLGLPPAKAAAAGSSGAKRGFADAIDANGKWVLGGSAGCDGETAKGGVLAAGKDGAAAAREKKADVAPAAKAQVVGWPPIRNYRKNTMATNPTKNREGMEDNQGSGCLYVKVSMDGAPYLRKVDLRMYCNYKELSSALEKMFSCFTSGSHGVPSKEVPCENRLNDIHGSEHVLTYEDKDGDWMLVGDVPWDMFIDTCKKLRIMKGSDAIGLAPRAAEKRKS